MTEKVLITRLRYIGDVVLTTPCIRRLRENLPRAEIVYLTQAPYGELLSQDPFLSRTTSIDLPSFGPKRALSLMWNLKTARYLYAIDLFGNPRSALFTASTLAKKRVGTYHLSRSWAYNVNVRVAAGIRSAVEHHLEHLRSIGLDAPFCLPELFVTKAEKEDGCVVLKNLGVREPSRTVIVQPGAKWQAKRWPSERFVELGRLLTRENLDVVFLAGPGEQELIAECGAKVPGAHLLAGLALRELVKVLSAGGAYVGNDGGPTHVAAALGTPTVAIFGPSEPDIWFPYEAGGKAACICAESDCRPCHLHFCEHVNCLEKIEAKRVFSKVMELIST